MIALLDVTDLSLEAAEVVDQSDSWQAEFESFAYFIQTQKIKILNRRCLLVAAPAWHHQSAEFMFIYKMCAVISASLSVTLLLMLPSGRRFGLPKDCRNRPRLSFIPPLSTQCNQRQSCEQHGSSAAPVWICNHLEKYLINALEKGQSCTK